MLQLIKLLTFQIFKIMKVKQCQQEMLKTEIQILTVLKCELDNKWNKK